MRQNKQITLRLHYVLFVVELLNFVNAAPCQHHTGPYTATLAYGSWTLCRRAAQYSPICPHDLQLILGATLV